MQWEFSEFIPDILEADVKVEDGRLSKEVSYLRDKCNPGAKIRVLAEAETADGPPTFHHQLQPNR